MRHARSVSGSGIRQLQGVRSCSTRKNQLPPQATSPVTTPSAGERHPLPRHAPCDSSEHWQRRPIRSGRGRASTYADRCIDASPRPASACPDEPTTRSRRWSRRRIQEWPTLMKITAVSHSSRCGLRSSALTTAAPAGSVTMAERNASKLSRKRRRRADHVDLRQDPAIALSTQAGRLPCWWCNSGVDTLARRRSIALWSAGSRAEGVEVLAAVRDSFVLYVAPVRAAGTAPSARMAVVELTLIDFGPNACIHFARRCSRICNSPSLYATAWPGQAM